MYTGAFLQASAVYSTLPLSRSHLQSINYSTQTEEPVRQDTSNIARPDLNPPPLCTKYAWLQKHGQF